jgi:hypothetical protein
LHDYIHTSACSLDETLIWNRQLLASQLRENLTVIHGHTPTKYYRQMTKLLKFWEEEENIPFVQRDKKTRQPAQIDIDTGLVYGGALTMLAINDEPDSQRVFEYYLSIDLKRNLRQNLFTKQELDIRLSKQ